MSAMIAAADDDSNDNTDGSLQEERHWNDVARTLLSYFDFVLFNIDKRRSRISKLSIVNFSLLPSCSYDKINNIEHACQNNQDILDDIVGFYERSEYLHYVSTSHQLRQGYIQRNSGDPIPHHQQHRNTAVLHSMYREWTAEGEGERKQAFDVITKELSRLLPVTRDSAYTRKVLLPGCGLARLPVEIAAMGYCSQGNEFSAFMVMANQYILNGITSDAPKSYSIYPWLDKESNVRCIKDIFQSYKFPDRTADDILNTGQYSQLNRDNETMFPRFSMVAGDFVELYSTDNHASAWDAVITCFFIDTAPVIMDYFRVIHGLLPTGGVWINLGPLLYHWAEDSEGSSDDRFSQSIELSFEEIEQIITDIGFEFITKEFDVKCNYCNFHKGLMYNTYNAIFFSVRKTDTFRKQIM